MNNMLVKIVCCREDLVKVPFYYLTKEITPEYLLSIHDQIEMIQETEILSVIEIREKIEEYLGDQLIERLDFRELSFKIN